MLHQTLISSSSFSLPSSSSSSSFLRPRYSHSPQVEKEKKMAFENQELLGGDDVYCAAIGEDFSVDDLLNFEIEEDEQHTKEEEEEEEKLLKEQEERNSNSSSALSFEPPPVSELALPAHDVAELEWVSRIMDDSEFPTYAPHPKTGTQNHTHTHTHATQPPLPVKAKRSKRTRSPSGTWAPLHLTDSSTASMTSSATSPTSSCSSSPSYYSHLIFAHPVVFDEIPLTPPFKKQKPHKKRGRKPKQQQLLHGHHQIGMSSNKEERRCSHCGVNKTPQWRTGPEGAKTLCNACGVRYKSGRLLPEYRPACSPNFVSHVHSNSHRKVMEMRRKKEEEDKLVFIPVVTSF